MSQGRGWGLFGTPTNTNEREKKFPLSSKPARLKAGAERDALDATELAGGRERIVQRVGGHPDAEARPEAAEAGERTQSTGGAGRLDADGLGRVAEADG